MGRSFSWALIVVAAAAMTAACASSSNKGSTAPYKASKLSELETVYFEFDRAGLTRGAKSALRGNAKTIRSNGDWGRIVVVGHADERGSYEYNMALGERRAKVVKKYLMDLGVPSSQIATMSYGESKPAKRGHDEKAWKKNRRVEFALAR